MRITSNMHRYSRDDLVMLYIEGLRATFRLWCKTGVLVEFDEALPIRKGNYGMKKGDL